MWARCRPDQALSGVDRVLYCVYQGYLALAERLHGQGEPFAGAWNFGPRIDDAKPVRWIVERAAELWGEGARWEADAGEHPHEAHYLKLDATKAGAELGWLPRLDLARALDWTVGWYRSVLAGADARALCEEQIHAYAREGAS